MNKLFMNMLIKLQDATLFSRAIEIISEVVIEVRIKVNEEGLSITAIDPANVAMVGFSFPKSAFSEFESDEEVLGVNLENLKKILKRCSPKSLLTLEKKESSLSILIEDKVRRTFTLRLIEVESEDKNMPNLEFSTRIEISSENFINAIEDCSVVADACSFSNESEKFVIEAQGLNSSRTEFSKGETQIQGEICNARYSLEYLSKFIKGAKLCDTTILNFAKNHPLKLEFRTGEMELDFILAPRVETED